MKQEQQSARKFVGRLTHNSSTRRKSPLFLALLAALSLGFFASRAQAQSQCLQGCQQTLAECLQRSGQDPVMEGACQDQYDTCVNACLGQFARLW